MQNISTSTCQYQSIFLGEVCPHLPLEGDRDNLCIFHSRNDKKGKEAFWKGIQAKLKAKDFDFAGYYFPPGLEADFSKKEFKDASFRSAIFKVDANFRGAKFSGKSTDFRGAKFSGGSTDFRLAEFSGESTVFVGAKFSGKITAFNVAKFSGKSTDFSWAKFLGEGTVFSGAKFSGESTDFSATIFSGKITGFSYASFHECSITYFVNTEFECECKFLNVEFPWKADQFVIFAGSRNPIDLSKVVFLYSNYDRIIFRNCTFPEGPEELFGWKFPDWQGWKRLLTWRRKVILNDESFIGEELKKITKEEEKKENLEEGSVWEMSRRDLQKEGKVRWSHVESLYRQFKKNLEAEKDWELAGEFHYGEMECKRKGITSQWPLGWLRRNLGLLAFYKYFSGYGERPFRALVCMASLIIFCTLFYWLFDFETHHSTLINLSVTSDVSQPAHDRGYWFWYSLKSAFWGRLGEQGAEPPHWLGKGVLLLESIFSPLFIALFILALRRRVRR